jgi:flagellar FliL protein
MAGPETTKGGGLKELLIPIVAMTVIGGGGGWFLGFSLLAPKDPPRAGAELTPKTEAEPHGAEPSHDGAGAHGKEHGPDKEAAKAPDPPETLQVKELPPIVTNLAAGKNWVRVQAAIVFDPKALPHAETLIPELMSDLTGFLNTLEVGDIEGSDGLRRLREELNERALIRSERHVRELVVESLVIQ